MTEEVAFLEDQTHESCEAALACVLETLEDEGTTPDVRRQVERYRDILQDKMQREGWVGGELVD